MVYYFLIVLIVAINMLIGTWFMKKLNVDIHENFISYIVLAILWSFALFATLCIMLKLFLKVVVIPRLIKFVNRIN